MRLRFAYLTTTTLLAGLICGLMLLALAAFTDAPAAADSTPAPRPVDDPIDRPTPIPANRPDPPVRPTLDLVVAPGPPEVPSTTPIRVLVVGDSITHGARDHIDVAMTTLGVEVQVLAWGGTASCDWIEPVAIEVARFDPDQVLIEFAGNDLTPCIADTPRGSARYLDRYAEAATALTAAASAGGATVHWASIPPMADPAYDTIARELNHIYRQVSHDGELLALRPAFTIDGGFTFDDDCRTTAECGDAAIGSTVSIRSDDGLHLTAAGSARLAGVYRDAIAN